MKKIALFFAGLLLLAHSFAANAETRILRDGLNRVYVTKADDDVGTTAHPAQLDPARVHNMLASLHFDRRALILKDVEEIRLFDAKGLKVLAPALTQGLAQAQANEAVRFQYVKKTPQWKVFRQDHLIQGYAYVRDGELFLHFTKLYAKLDGDYQRPGQDNLVMQARDAGASLSASGGQRILGPKAIALQLNYDYAKDLEHLAEEAKAAEAAAQKEEEVRGIPVPTSSAPTPLPGDPKRSKTEKISTPSTNDSSADSKDVETRLKTLDELRSKKLISEGEYQRKRREILQEL